MAVNFVLDFFLSFMFDCARDLQNCERVSYNPPHKQWKHIICGGGRPERVCVWGGGGRSVIGKRCRLMGRLNSGQYVHVLSTESIVLDTEALENLHSELITDPVYLPDSSTAKSYDVSG